MNWLEVMPEIPLAPNVPIVSKGREPDTIDARGAYVQRSDTHGDRVAWNWFDWAAARVDLDDPQGFGYALRWFQQNRDKVDANTRVAHGTKLPWVEARHSDGRTTDEDKLWLALAIAKVIAEVARG